MCITTKNVDKLKHTIHFQNQKINLMKHLFLLASFILLHSFSWGQISPNVSYTQNFDGVSGGLPTGWTVRTGSSATALGTTQTLNTSAIAWATSTGQFANFASADGLTSSSNSAAQAANTDRVLGVRQSAAFGDPGASFCLQISNTIGLANYQMAFKLMSLDPTTPVARTTAWKVDYGFGASPTTWTTIATSPASISTQFGSWNTTNVASYHYKRSIYRCWF
jgi:trimeric autotransporter adhesin